SAAHMIPVRTSVNTDMFSFRDNAAHQRKGADMRFNAGQHPSSNSAVTVADEANPARVHSFLIQQVIQCHAQTHDNIGLKSLSFVELRLVYSEITPPPRPRASVKIEPTPALIASGK